MSESEIEQERYLVHFAFETPGVPSAETMRLWSVVKNSISKRPDEQVYRFFRIIAEGYDVQAAAKRAFGTDTALGGPPEAFERAVRFSSPSRRRKS